MEITFPLRKKTASKNRNVQEKYQPEVSPMQRIKSGLMMKTDQAATSNRLEREGLSEKYRL